MPSRLQGFRTREESDRDAKVLEVLDEEVLEQAQCEGLAPVIASNKDRNVYVLWHFNMADNEGILRGREGYARMVRRAEKGGLRKANSLKGNRARSWTTGVKR